MKLSSAGLRAREYKEIERSTWSRKIISHISPYMTRKFRGKEEDEIAKCML